MTYANFITVLVIAGILPAIVFIVVYRPSKWNATALDQLAWPLAMLAIFLLALLGQTGIDITTWWWRGVRLLLALGLNVVLWQRTIRYIMHKPRRKKEED